MIKNIFTDKEKIRDFCERNYIQKLAIYGSVLRDDFDKDSDIDVLIDFMPGHVPGFFRLFDMEEELSVILGGCKVDLRTPEDLSRYFRDRVVAEAQVQYVRR